MEPEDSPDSIHMPRMEPPPPSLEAMVQSRTVSAKPEPSSSTGWLLWLMLVVVAAGITAYVTR